MKLIILKDMEEKLRGLYRTVPWAYVSNGLMSFQVNEADYQKLGYQPDYDDLPWREDFLAANSIRLDPDVTLNQ